MGDKRAWVVKGEAAALSSVAEPELLAEIQRMWVPPDPAITREFVDDLFAKVKRFLSGARDGDLVAQPQPGGVVVIGRVSSQGTNCIEELATTDRAAVRSDLRDSIDSATWVAELKHRDAVSRLESLAEKGFDPGYSGYVEPPADAAALVREVEETGTRQLSARDLIALWSLKRRDQQAVDHVDGELARLGLVTEPHFAVGQLDDLVTVTVAPSTTPEPDHFDLVWRVGNVARQQVVTARLDDSLESAYTKMCAHGFSQLPVLDPNGRLKGVITWESIAQAKMSGAPRTVAEAMSDAMPKTAAENEPLFARIDDIKRHDYLLIVDDDHTVRGIVTAADLSAELRDRVEPFILLEEIERRLRRVVAALPLDDLRDGSHQRPARVATAEDLTFGDYPRLLDDDVRWRRLALPYDRAELVERVRRVKEFRNSVAHWSVDAPGRETDALAEARQLLNLLKLVDRDG